jgi:hypothetical protein
MLIVSLYKTFEKDFDEKYAFERHEKPKPPSIQWESIDCEKWIQYGREYA